MPRILISKVDCVNFSLKNKTEEEYPQITQITQIKKKRSRSSRQEQESLVNSHSGIQFGSATVFAT
jgi:hypothetical protein